MVLVVDAFSPVLPSPSTELNFRSGMDESTVIVKCSYIDGTCWICDSELPASLAWPKHHNGKEVCMSYEHTQLA